MFLLHISFSDSYFAKERDRRLKFGYRPSNHEPNAKETKAKRLELSCLYHIQKLLADDQFYSLLMTYSLSVFFCNKDVKQAAKFLLFSLGCIYLKTERLFVLLQLKSRLFVLLLLLLLMLLLLQRCPDDDCLMMILTKLMAMITTNKQNAQRKL